MASYFSQRKIQISQNAYKTQQLATQLLLWSHSLPLFPSPLPSFPPLLIHSTSSEPLQWPFSLPGMRFLTDKRDGFLPHLCILCSNVTSSMKPPWLTYLNCSSHPFTAPPHYPSSGYWFSLIAITFQNMINFYWLWCFFYLLSPPHH